MELYSAEATAIQNLAKDWIAKPDTELEATFGAGGRVSATTFMAIAQRLRAKGYTPLPAEDRLVILTPDRVRFSLVSLAIIQAYCDDNDIVTKAFEAMIKDRASVDSKVDLDDYDARVKECKEIRLARDDPTLRKMFEDWGEQRKAFRMIKRWSFEGDGLRVDMSVVRSSKRDPKGGYKWQRQFRDQDILNSPPVYEIEVELLRKPDDTAEEAMKRLIKGMGEVLRGIQKNSLLIRKSQAAKVLAAYKELTGTEQFRGPSMKTLMRENFSERDREKKQPNIRDGFNVTDKADGLRALGFVDGKGELYLIDTGLNVYRTGLRQPELRMSLVDGEWVTKTKDRPAKPLNHYLVFDIFYAEDKRDVSRFPFQPGAVMPDRAGVKDEKEREAGAGASTDAGPPPPPEDSRHSQLLRWVQIWNKDAGPKVVAGGVTTLSKLNVGAKEFFFGVAGNDSIFRLASRAWHSSRVYYTDGLIFTPNANPLPSRPDDTFEQQFKWKPPHDNTIDFLVRIEKAKKGSKEHRLTTGVKPDTGETVTYKTLRLYVGSRKDNPREMILLKKKLPPPERAGDMGRRGGDYHPVLFTPKEFPDPFASICYLPTQVDPDTGEIYVKTGEPGEPGEPIQDETIVEMAYDPSQPPGWRWRPLRVRMDKTEKYQKGTLVKTLNGERTAENVWQSIYDPVTESMITAGTEDPSEEELAAMGDAAVARDMAARRYFDRKAVALDGKLTKPMVTFHNRWVKEKILYPTGLAGDSKILLDLACGQGNDLHIWRRTGVDFVLGVDLASQNILDPKDGAWARYASVAQDARGVENVEPMAFAIADITKPLINPPAGNAAAGTEEDKDILRSIFGRMRPIGSVPPYISETVASRLKTGADCVSCMFSLHYFFESAEKFDGVLRNLADTLKVGGYFIGCCFDGEKVFETLRDKAMGNSIVGQEEQGTLWKITKEYDAEDLLENGGFGHAINVLFNTIGMGHKEYLVPFAVLTERLSRVGLELLTADELRDLGLKNSTAMFETSYEMAKAKGMDYKLSPVAKEFSFFNRWFIFKRKRAQAMAAAVVAEAAEAAAARGDVGGPAAEEAQALQEAVRPTAGRAAAARNAAAANAAAASALQREMAETVAKTVNGLPASAAAEGGPADTAAPARTVPVAPGPAAAPGSAPQVYEPGEIFIFWSEAQATRDMLKIKDKGAGRWLAPSAPFPIPDPDDDKILYPTVNHFLGAMRVKRASNKPDRAPLLFGREGTIHQRFLNDRVIESKGGTKPLTEERDHEYTLAEEKAVKDAMLAKNLLKSEIVVNEADWATVKDEVLTQAYEYRWNRDARLRKIVEAARNQNKILLYYTPGASTSNLGGIHRRNDGRIIGENRIGKVLMRLAGYPS